MVYLYRFELVGWEEGTSHPFMPASGGTPQGPLYTLTNNEAPLSLVDPGGPAFLPSGSLTLRTWEPTPISHDGVRLDGEDTAGSISVSLPVGHPLAQHYSLDPGGYRLWVRIFTLAGDVVAPFFTGLAADFDYAEQMLVLQVQPLELVLAQQGLTAKHPRSCPKMVFSSACRAKAFVSEEIGGGRFYYKHAEQGFIGSLSADGLTLTVPEAANRADGFFVGGIVMVGPDFVDAEPGTSNLATRAEVVGGIRLATPYEGTLSPVHGGYRRTVIAQAGPVLTLQAPLPARDYSTGKYNAVTLIAGCPGTQSVCISRFGNGRNFGGYPFIPLKDPNKVGILAAL